MTALPLTCFLSWNQPWVYHLLTQPALFATLAGLAYATGWNNHVLALSGVAVLLFASISW